jgi:hypothetical protein
MQRQFCFLKLVCFFSWLAGRFHNFELTQNREKTRNGLNNKDLKLNFSKRFSLNQEGSNFGCQL